MVDQANVGKEYIIHTFPGDSQAKVDIATRNGEIFIETTHTVENFRAHHQASAGNRQEIGRHQ